MRLVACGFSGHKTPKAGLAGVRLSVYVVSGVVLKIACTVETVGAYLTFGQPYGFYEVLHGVESQ